MYAHAQFYYYVCTKVDGPARHGRRSKLMSKFLRYTPKDRKKNASLAKKTVLDGPRSISQ